MFMELEKSLRPERHKKEHENVYLWYMAEKSAKIAVVLG
jgi:hypothetical protein